jgi:microcompartment protein CcmK/EutM
MAADYYQHEATLTGLTPGTSYSYDILVDGVDANPQDDTFRTAPSDDTSTVRFVAFGDSGVGSTVQRQIASLLEAESFDFMLHGGDLAYGFSNGTGDGSYQTLNDWFFSIYGNSLRRKPVFPSMGNHDSRASTSNGNHYVDMFVLPRNGADATYPDHAERYYSFNYGPLHVVVLDTELAFQDLDRRAAQLAWLESDLSSATQPWKIAVFHRAPFSAGGEHGSDLAVRAAFSPVFERDGVQAVFSAHEHIYERTKPWMVGSQGTPVTYFVTGGGGAPLYPVGTDEWTAVSARRHHYMRGTVTSCSLAIEAVGSDASVFDSVTLNRCGGADTEDPTVSITAPAPGATVSGNTTVTATASDNVGVTLTELFIDGVSAAQDTTAPYSFTWFTTTTANGTHQLMVRASDAAGNSADSGTVQVTVDNPTAGAGDIVLYAGDSTVRSGGWRRESNTSAAGGAVMRHPDGGAAKRTTALASPTDYFELTFEAQADVPYHLWIRSKADDDDWANDSVFVQFSGASNFAIGTTSATEMNLEDCKGCGLSGWGWQDNGWGVGVRGPHIVFTTSGTHRIRVQTREDGLSIDQIVLSPSMFLTQSPGTLKNDTNIYPKQVPAPGDTEPPTTSITSPSNGATVSGTTPVTTTASDNVSVTRVELWVDGSLALTDNASPFTFSWNTASVANGNHTLQSRAYDAANNVGQSTTVAVTVNNATSGPADIVLYAGDATVRSGGWRRESDTSAAGAAVMRHPNAGAAKRTTALASPTDYFELTFEAEANAPYHLWLRSQADNDDWANDSVFIQFTGASSYAIGTTSAAEMNLEDCKGCGLSGWGWQDNGWGVNVAGPHIVFTTSGTHRIRIQTREDGLAIDQIILSPSRFLTTPPGTLKNDTHIYPRSSTPPAARDIVLYASDATVIVGAWRRESDASAAGGLLMHQPNQGVPKFTSASAAPANYFELTFTPEANVSYHLWARIKAENDNWANESVYIQFSSGTPYTIGTTAAADVNLENCSGCGVSGWGWQDNGWGAQVDGPNITFTSGGATTLRVQTREDGTYIDQIVLSPATYLSSAPGPLKNDETILPKQ